MKVSVTKNKRSLPPLPFGIRLSSSDDWYKLLDEYPEIEQKFMWYSRDSLRETNYVNRLYRYFDENHVITASEYLDSYARLNSWPIVEYP